MGNRKKCYGKKYETNKKILKKLRYLEESGAIDENSVLQQEDATLTLNQEFYK